MGRGRLPGALAVALAGGLARAGEPGIRIVAEIDADGTIRGTLSTRDLPGIAFLDPLAELPSPADEIERTRTFPGAPEVGSVRWTHGPEGLAFTTRLPSRWEDVGRTAHGLFANGAWYPQPEGLPVVAWDVTVRATSGTVVVGDAVGSGQVRWTGVADRASLAVVPRATTTPLAGPGFDVAVVTRGRPRPTLLRHLGRQLTLAHVEGRHADGTVVVAPLRRRLARGGADVAYVSDRAWRLTPGFYRLHHRGVVRGVAAGLSEAPTAWERELEAAGVARLHDQRLTRRARVDLLGLTRWIPLVDAALYTREMSFQAELFGRVSPTDTARDDLAERFAPHAPAPLALAQLADAHGVRAADQVAADLSVGVPAPLALARAGLSPDDLAVWVGPYPTDQDYRIDLEGTRVTVRRIAPVGAPPETVVVAADAQRIPVAFDAGPGTRALDLPSAPRRVRLDPGRHVGQRDRSDDIRPPPLRWTLWGQLSSVNLGERFVNAYVTASVRRADDTRHAFRVTALTSQRAWVSGRFTWTWFGGRLVQPTTREHAVTIGLDGAWLNPGFADGGDLGTLGATLGWAWDNRESILFPRRGARVGFAASAGAAVGSGRPYVRFSATAAGQLAPHPRHVLAGRVGVGLAETDIAQERLSFGGFAGVRGLPDDLVQTDRQVTASVEYRGVPLHQGSVPLLGLTWIRDLHLIGGFDLGLGELDGQPVSAVGGVLGAGAIVDNLGLSPGAITFTFAWPITTSGLVRPEGGLPFELYLTWGVTF